MLDVKTQQVTEAQDQITALQNQQAVVQVRYNFYSTIAFMNAWEMAAIALQGGALIANGLAVILDTDFGNGAHGPDRSRSASSGFGGTPTVTANFGGENIGNSASVLRGGLPGHRGNTPRRRRHGRPPWAATSGGQDDWNLQAKLASAELTQIASQIAAAQDRLTIAQQELSIQNAQIANAQTVSDFLASKYTNAQLYNWMITQLTTVYTQAYQLAFSLALQAQNAYQYELGSQTASSSSATGTASTRGSPPAKACSSTCGAWRRSTSRTNSRELELTKHISLALTSPLSLVHAARDRDLPDRAGRDPVRIRPSRPVFPPPSLGRPHHPLRDRPVHRGERDPDPVQRHGPHPAARRPDTSPQGAAAPPNDRSVVYLAARRGGHCRPSPPAAGKTTPGSSR